MMGKRGKGLLGDLVPAWKSHMASNFSGILSLMFWMVVGGGDVQAVNRPNVLFVICDDLNDTVEGLGGHPQAYTPNIDRLVRTGVSFRNAHCNAPICGPSRASLFTGFYPHTSGVYGANMNKYTWRDSPVLRDAVSVFEHFQNHGYETYASGKIFHNNHHTVPLFRKAGEYDRFGAYAFFGPFPWDGKSNIYAVPHPTMKKPWGKNGFEIFAPLSDIPNVPPNPLTGAPGFDGWYNFNRPFRYNSSDDRDQMPDEYSAQWASERLGWQHDKPFFMTIGFLRPHEPWIVPQKYFDMFPLEEIQLPPYLENDLDDCGAFIREKKGKSLPAYTKLERLLQAYPEREGWKQVIRGYLASVAFADDQLGKVLDALEQSPYADNTIIIFTSDNGYHLGEKNMIEKRTLWEESTRVPLIIRAPGVTKGGLACEVPVSLIDLYPTLIDLCRLPAEPNMEEGRGNGRKLEGYTLRPLLVDPVGGFWSGPTVVLTELEGGDPVEIGEIPPLDRQLFTVRSARWRYCLYNNGDEELYDHQSDPNEWHNIAANPERARIKAELREELRRLSGR